MKDFRIKWLKNDILRFLREPEGEFMAVIPVGYTARINTAPQKQSLETIVKYL